jgi:hypothetical protein
LRSSQNNFGVNLLQTVKIRNAAHASDYKWHAADSKWLMADGEWRIAWLRSPSFAL